MFKGIRSHASAALALATVVLLIAAAAPVAAAAQPLAFSMELDPGLACRDIGLRVDGYGTGTTSRQLPNGDVISAGTGYTLVFTKMGSDKSLTLNSNGSVQFASTSSSGVTRLALMGHNVVILFPTDNGGPSTILYVGQANVTIDAAGTWTVTKVAGTSLDICAALR
jgi:hypothetical protein